VDRNTCQKARRQPWFQISQAEALRREMHAVSAGSEGNIGPPIDQYPALSGLGQCDYAAGQIEKLSVGKILFANLNEIHPSLDDAANVGEECLSAKLPSIRDVVQEGLTLKNSF
jgi:hypothetical protein